VSAPSAKYYVCWTELPSRTAQKQILESAREVPLGGNIKYSISREEDTRETTKMASRRIAEVTKLEILSTMDVEGHGSIRRWSIPGRKDN